MANGNGGIGGCSMIRLSDYVSLKSEEEVSGSRKVSRLGLFCWLAVGPCSDSVLGRERERDGASALSASRLFDR